MEQQYLVCSLRPLGAAFDHGMKARIHVAVAAALGMALAAVVPASAQHPRKNRAHVAALAPGKYHLELRDKVDDLPGGDGFALVVEARMRNRDPDYPHRIASAAFGGVLAWNISRDVPMLITDSQVCSGDLTGIWLASRGSKLTGKLIIIGTVIAVYTLSGTLSHDGTEFSGRWVANPASDRVWMTTSSGTFTGVKQLE